MRIDELFTKEDKKTLYICRNLVNADDFIAWAKEQGFSHCTPADKLHVTIAFSREKVDWSRITPLKDQIVVKGGMRKLENFSGANVLRFESDALENRWAELLEDHDCSWDHSNFKPHITISYKGEGLDLRKMVPYQGELIFGPERFKEIDTSYRDELEETELTEDVMTLGNDLDPERAYEIFKKSYTDATGSAFSKEHFLSRARNWLFYGDQDGFVSVRKQYSGPKKLVGVAGNPFSILKGLNELMSEGGPIWGAVSKEIVKMAVKKGFIAPHTYIGGPFLIRKLVSSIPPSVFGGETPEVNKDGSITVDVPDVGPVTKYLIGNKEYFKYALGLPHVAEKLKEIPGVKTTLKLMGLSS